MIDRIVVLVPRGRNEGSLKKVLWIKLDAIGDFIVWLDAAKEIRSIFPSGEWEVTILGNAAWTSFAERLPFFDAAWPLDRHKFINNPFYRFQIMKKVRRAGFDAVVHPTFSRQFLFGDAVVNICGAPVKIGSQGDCTNIQPRRKSAADRKYTRLIPAAATHMTELERNGEFMKGLGLDGFRPDIPRIPIRTVLPFGFKEKNYYILFPGAGAPIRQWPISRFAELAEQMFDATNWSGIICGSREDFSVGQAILQNSTARLENWCGQTTVEELIAVVSNSSVLIGNETSGVHIAAALSIPAVCVIGGGHYGRFLPYPATLSSGRRPIVTHVKMACYHCNWNCAHDIQPDRPAPCISAVTTASVWDAVKTVLKTEVHSESRLGL